jgi:hypothetical protein
MAPVPTASSGSGLDEHYTYPVLAHLVVHRLRVALGALYDACVLRPVIDRTFSFEQTAEAMAHVEQGRTRAGKVVVTMRAAPDGPPDAERRSPSPGGRL